MCMATRTSQVPSKAPRTLLISNEFIAGKLRSGETGGQCTISQFAARLATRISRSAMADILILIPARMVATDSADVAAIVEKAGGRAVLTRADHASGSDRIFEALGKVDSQRSAKIIINLQGDLPT